MKIAFVTNYNSEDISQWSGTGYFMAQALEQEGVQLVRINCQSPYLLTDRIKARLLKMWKGKDFQPEREPGYLKRLSRITAKQLEGADYDVIFSATSLPISYLKSKKPIAFCSDATYDCMVNFYPGWKNIAVHSIWQGNRAESLAIDNSAMVFYSSDWARNNAISKYNVSPLKIKKICFGANIICNRTTNDVEKLVADRDAAKTVKLLIIGVHWQRKGIDKSIEVARNLKAAGIETTLTIIGCDIPENISLPDFVQHHPFISKSTTEGIALLNQYFEDSHFFILPTLAECYGVVFCEAASYGLPVITTNVGGVPSVVANGVTGYCLQPETFVTDAFEKIKMLLSSRERYREMSVNAFTHFKANLNWRVAAKKTLAELSSLIKQ
jgi:glycosyltransferase involved in cell wall biosynthesis